MKLKVGIAGYGIVGKRRRQFIDKNSNLETVAVCDQNFKKHNKFYDGVRCYTHFRQLLEEQLDVLFVSLPNYLAPEVTIAGLEEGLHVFYGQDNEFFRPKAYYKYKIFLPKVFSDNPGNPIFINCS